MPTDQEGGKRPNTEITNHLAKKHRKISCCRKCGEPKKGLRGEEKRERNDKRKGKRVGETKQKN